MSPAHSLIITGMHRSATSLVASLLHAGGLPLGTELIGPERGNPRGHFEDRDFFKFHQRALLSRGRLPVMGGDFTFVPTAAESRAADDLVAVRRSFPLWGFKDPRACLFLDFWQERIPRARFLFLYRHPLEVLWSLVRRLEPLADLRQGLDAWRLHNERLLDFHERFREDSVLCHAYAAIDHPERLGQRLAGLGLQLDLQARTRDRVYHAPELKRLDLSDGLGERFARLFPEMVALYARLEATADLAAPGDGGGFCPSAETLRHAREDDPNVALLDLMGAIDATSLVACLGETGRVLIEARVGAHWLEEKLIELRDALAAQERDRTWLLAQEQRSKEEIAHLAQEWRGAVAEAKERAIQFDAARAWVVELEAAKTSLSAEIEEQRTDLSQMAVRLAATRQELACARNGADLLNRDLSEKEVRLADLESALAREKQEHQSAIDQRNALHTALATLNTSWLVRLSQRLGLTQTVPGSRLPPAEVPFASPAVPPDDARTEEIGRTMLGLRELLLERAGTREAVALPVGSTLPFVSVIVLNLNGEKILRRCLDQLMCQTYPVYEVIAVDNGSTDGSLAILEEYLGSGRLTAVRSMRNRGCPGGRNLGLLHARGEVIAFIDNDGYADPRWLEEAVRALLSDATVGAVAPVVFFARRPIIINGVGGRLNRQGYGCDQRFKAPLESSMLPTEALYPMGCGMVVRREILDRGGPFDDALLNYYDDVELGIRTWKLGYRVAVAPRARVDHECGFSTHFVRSKAEMCEKGRIRTMLKYAPLATLRTWLVSEARYREWYSHDKSIFVEAWRWNLRHLGSVLSCRLRFAWSRGRFEELLVQSWGHYPPPIPSNDTFRPRLDKAGPTMVFDGRTDEAHLNYGWYYPESDGTIPYRWSDTQASILLRLNHSAESLSVYFCLPFAHESRLRLRRWGSLEPLLDRRLEPENTSWGWNSVRFPCSMTRGDYEVQFVTEGGHPETWGRRLGVAVSRIQAA